MAGVKFTHVPYKGQPEAVNDLLGGNIDMMPPTAAIAKGHIATGKLKGLAVTTAKRATALPDLPTVAEAAGLPGYDVGTWFGFVVPGKVPDPIVARLAQEVAAVLAMPRSPTSSRAWAWNWHRRRQPSSIVMWRPNSSSGQRS